MKGQDVVVWLRANRALILGLTILLLIVAGAFVIGQLGREPEPVPPWERAQAPPPRPEVLAVAIVYDVSGSIPQGLGRSFAEALADANESVVGIVCQGKAPGSRWRGEGQPPKFAQAEKSLAILKIGAPRKTQPYFTELTQLGKVERDSCDRIAEHLPKTGFNHPLSYIELGKAEATSVLQESARRDGATTTYLVVVSDFKEGPAKDPIPEWDAAVNQYLTSFVEETRFSAYWTTNSLLKIRVIEVKRR